MQLSVIIVNYNVKFFLEQCLCSVMKAVEHIPAEILVVDNNSTDGSRDFFTGRFSSVRFIWNNDNLGFAKANNIALKEARGKYILFLNPDTLIPEDCLLKCLEFMELHPDAGALGIKMLNGSGAFLKESKRSFPSPSTSFYKLSGLSTLFPHSEKFSRYHLGHLDENKDHSVDVLAGAFMMVPKKILDTVGSFDEDFFMYGEDIDLSYRIKKAGFSNYYFSGSHIIHFKGESTRKGGLNYVRLFYKAMSIFAKKHYGHRAALFNFMIQTGIVFRAVLSALKRFLRWIGIPVIDGAVILGSFWATKYLWNHYIKKDVNYSPNLLMVAFPVFTVIFLAASYYSGLYDRGYKQKRLNHSMVIAFLLLLSLYALLPEHLRFSRGIVVFGSIAAFLIMTLIRWLLVRWKVIERDDRAAMHRQTFITGSEYEFSEVNRIMKNAGMEERVIGRIDVHTHTVNAIGSIEQLPQLLRSYSVKEVIFCEGVLSFKKIIELSTLVRKNIKLKFHATGTLGIIGSHSNDMSGKYISSDINMSLARSLSRRNKTFIDILISIFFIITFPVHLLLQRTPFSFYRNVFAVLFLKRTWVGYAAPELSLPPLRPGILTSTGIPQNENTLPAVSLAASDRWYATDYEVWNDVKMIFRGYRYLGK